VVVSTFACLCFQFGENGQDGRFDKDDWVIPNRLQKGLCMMMFSFRSGNGRIPLRLRVRLHVELLEDRQVLSTLTNPAVIPTPGDYSYWDWRESQIIETPRGNPNVVFLGDSITDAFATTVGAPVWNAAIAPLQADNFGIGGATTQTVLWQIDHDGVLNGLSPQVVVLLIGTNNLAEGQTPAQVAEGITATVGAIQAQQPQAQILLLGILPRGASPDDPMRGLVAQTNQLIAPLGTLNRVTYLDIGGAFLQGDGSISPLVMADYLHPTLLGYERMTVALMPSLYPWLQSPAPLHQSSEVPLAGDNPDISAPAGTVQTVAQNVGGPSVITAVLPPPGAASVVWPTLPGPSLAIRPVILTGISIPANEGPASATEGNQAVGYASLPSHDGGDTTDKGDLVGWTADVWGNG
jgi:beta-glucosidase